ncbi:MAG: hypothetical protein ACKJSK_21465 [Roseibacillus sp.]|jgi:nucleoid DNA-binding protein
MDELKKRLMEKVGLDEEKSQDAIEVVLDFIKEQLPETLRGMVDGFVSGDDDNPLDAVKGFFGGD